MQQYSNSLFRQFPNSVTGNAATGISVNVYEFGTTNRATLYATDDLGGATLPNPLTTNDIGFYSFYAPDGKYTLNFGSSQFPDLNIQLIDALSLVNEFNTAQAATGFILIDNGFSAGYTVTQRNEALLYDGVYYVWKGDLEKTVPAGSSVATTGGIGNGAWQAVLDNTLEQRLVAGTAPIGSVNAGDVSDLVEGIADGSALIAGQTAQSVADLVEGIADGTADIGSAKASDLAKATINVVNLKALADIPVGQRRTGITYRVMEFNAGTGIGGHDLKWNPTKSWTSADVGLVWPDVALNAWNGTAAGLSALYGSFGSGVGCWVRAGSAKQVDFEAYGATVNGADSTLACDKALLTNPRGSFFWRAGVLTVQYLKFSDNQSMMCGGFGSVLKHADNATEDLITTRDPATTVHVTLSNFKIFGNKDNQTNPVSGVHLIATGMPSPTLCRHNLNNLYIEACKGEGLIHPFPGRDSNYSNIVIYNCDGDGALLLGSDSQFTNMNIGQSGLSGVKVNGGSANKISNTKAWYSGRLNAGVGYGWWVRNGTGTQLSNVSSQENSNDGFFFDGATATLTGIVAEGVVSNSDNTANNNHNGLRLINVEGARIDAKVWAVPALAGAPSDALSIGGGTTGCKINLMASDFTSYAIDGNAADIANNQITLNNRESNIVVENISGFKSFNMQRSKTFDWTLTGNATINNTDRIYGGFDLVLWIRQDSVGGRSISFGTQYVTNYVANLAPNAINIFIFKASRDGKWIQESFTSLTL